MTYRNSLLSLYPPTPTPTTPKISNSDQDADLTSQFEELPAAAPVFEGYLYLRTDKKQWQWRMFRFDGTCFTCLSTRKVKLPPNTHVDAPPLNDQPLMQSLPSFTTTSLTSPLLATPTNKSRQKSTTSAAMPLANYYQLPKWTVDITNISAVSVLKPSSSSNKKKLTMLPSQKQARCFCVRTFDGNCYIMKAQKQKDLERWLFVLTKMWKFAQAMKHQLTPQQPQHQQILRQQQQIRVGTHTPSFQQTQYSSSFLTPHHRLQSQDSIPLSHMYQRPRHTSLTCPHLPLETGNAMNTTLPMVKPQVKKKKSLNKYFY
ncbi:hypothetical protein BCR42DRAFT_124824 [Absidia repens]|uniref:PH domain-containing protein n=1 Tax=Absidia repens TaxID=90262 RepID=A0A1X2I3Z2_9FUNG|nr:hypothetical protein BCR42DRAFT_124824 [Absidia repens]